MTDRVNRLHALRSFRRLAVTVAVDGTGPEMGQAGAGVTLGHSDGGEELVMRATGKRGRFDVTCHVTAGGDPAHKAAAKVTVTPINLNVSQLTPAADEPAPGTRRKLARCAMRQACRYQTWHRAQCLLIDTIQPFPAFPGGFCFALAGPASAIQAGTG
jgi:hypothetical protein